MFATICTLVFGTSVLLAIGALTRAHCHTVLAQQLRASFYLGSMTDSSTDSQLVRKDLRNRIEAVLRGWPIVVELGNLTLTMADFHGQPAAQVSAEFIPGAGLIPGFGFTEKAVVFSENG